MSESEVKQTRHEVIQKDILIDELQMKCRNLEIHSQTVEAQFNQLRAEKTSGELQQKELLIAEQMSQIKRLEQQLFKVSNELNEHRVFGDSEVDKVAQMEDELSALNREVKDRDEQLQRYEEKYEELREVNKSLRQQLQRYDANYTSKRTGPDATHYATEMAKALRPADYDLSRDETVMKLRDQTDSLPPLDGNSREHFNNTGKFSRVSNLQKTLLESAKNSTQRTINFANLDN